MDRGTSAAATFNICPEIVVDPTSNRQYARGAFLGQGGCASCFEFVDIKTQAAYAGKVISKTLFADGVGKETVDREIHIHKSLNHKHVVSLESHFEDEEHVYIILELCNGGSLYDLLQTRKTLTEDEAANFLRQLLLACRYLRQQKVLHRDLKPGNLLLNDNMELKVGDFGHSTRVDEESEMIASMQGTIGYTAPEVLTGKECSYEADIWSIGCILYTMLVGRPPFEADTVQETSRRIKQCDYSVPCTVSSSARALIEKILDPKPKRRPSIEAILRDDFITSRTDIGRDKHGAKLTTGLLEGEPEDASSSTATEEEWVPGPVLNGTQQEMHVGELQWLLQDFHSVSPPERDIELLDEAADPAVGPDFWISRWADYTDDNGLGYQLCDSSVGVLFCDNTCVMLQNDGVNVIYVDEDGLENRHLLKDYPSSLKKKIILLKSTCCFLEQRLVNTGRCVRRPAEGDSLVQPPCLGTWLRSQDSISFYLTNGTLQINFKDHTKVILCPSMAAVSYINSRGFHTYRLQTLKQGCPQDLLTRLKFARSVLQHLGSEF